MERTQGWAVCGIRCLPQDWIFEGAIHSQPIYQKLLLHVQFENGYIRSVTVAVASVASSIDSRRSPTK